jgi:branched-chain amino acid transport system substrate-binding protein
VILPPRRSEADLGLSGLGNRCIGASAPARAEDVFRSGLAMPLTGSQALYGQDQVRAAEWAVAKINKDGGVNGKAPHIIGTDLRIVADRMVEPAL